MRKLSIFILQFFTIFFLALILGSFSAHAKFQEEFSNIYTFGDSFSYQGTWTELLMKRYGINYTDNKNGFAFGGGKIFDLPIQLSNYTSNVGGFDSNGLYLVFMGPSDSANSHNGTAIPGGFLGFGFEANQYNNTGLSFDDFVMQYNKGVFNFSDLFPQTYNDIQNRAKSYGSFINHISANGAHYIVLLNQFNDGLRQDGSSEWSLFFHGIWSNEFNQAVNEQIARQAPHANIIFVDTKRLLNEVTSNPTAYFTPDQLQGTQENQGFFISAHPTGNAHQLIQNYVASILEAPSRVALMRELPINNGLLVINTVAKLAGDSNNFNNNSKSFTIMPTGTYQLNYAPDFGTKQLGLGTSHLVNPAILANCVINDQFIMGTQVHYFYNYSHFAKKYGRGTVSEPAVSLHAMYNNAENHVFGYITGGFSNIKYNIRRDIQLGKNQISEQGKTTGKRYMAAGGFGYNYTLKDTTLTPFLNTSYQSVSLKSYKERGEIRSTTMAFKVPRRDSFLGEVGLKIAKELIARNISISPMLSLSYVHEFANTISKRAQSRVSDMPKYFFIPTYEIPKSSFNMSSGVSIKINNRMFIDLNLGIKPFNKVSLVNAGLSASIHF